MTPQTDERFAGESWQLSRAVIYDAPLSRGKI